MAHAAEDVQYEIDMEELGPSGVRVCVSMVPRGEEAWVDLRRGDRIDFMRFARDALDDEICKEPPLDESQAEESK